MRFVALFEDNNAMADIRRRREQDHFAYLRNHASEIIVAGGLREEAGGAFVGGLWVLEVPSKTRAKELVENDPYFLASRRGYRLLVWGKANPDIPATL